MAKEKIAAPPEQKHELRREVSVWGCYMWGYADVGANTFVALGLVMAYAQGAASLVFAIAGLTYVLIGLAYTELASTYPVSGGGPYYTLRSLGDFWGFVAGSGLLFAFTIDINLFFVGSARFLNFLVCFLCEAILCFFFINNINFFFFFIFFFFVFFFYLFSLL